VETHRLFLDPSEVRRNCRWRRLLVVGQEMKIDRRCEAAEKVGNGCQIDLKQTTNNDTSQGIIICQCDGGPGSLVEETGEGGSVSVSLPVNVPGVLQDQSMSCGGDSPTEIRIIKVDVDVDAGSVTEDQLAQLAHTNVTTASIITIPVVPYTVIGDTDEVSAHLPLHFTNGNLSGWWGCVLVLKLCFVLTEWPNSDFGVAGEP